MPTLSQLGPFDFGSLSMGLWGAAAALPLLIHLLNRRQFREEQWAAMEYLLRALRKHSQRIRIEQLLLLLIRSLILLLAALAWMDLLWNASRYGAAAGGHGSLHTVLVIDGSYSMSTRLEDASRFDRAKQLAGDLVDSAARGDAFTLVLLADPPRVVIGQPAFDRQDVKQEITTLTLPHAGADLSASLSLVEKLLKEVKAKQQRITAQRVCIISDLGRNTWGKLEDNTVHDCLQRIASGAPVTLLDVGQQNVENVAVSSLAVKEAYVVAGRDVHFAAQVKNFGAGDRANHSIRLFVDDRPVDEQQIDLAAGAEGTVTFAYAFVAAGEHLVEVRIEDDALAIDNHRWLSVPVRESLRVLCIAGKPGAADHLALALSPERSAEPIIRTEIAAESAIEERDLAGYDAVVLCNVARFSSDEAAVLRAYVRHGGGLLVTLGDQAVPESYNQWLVGPASAQPLLPAEVGGLASDGPYRFDPKQYEHPIVDVFRGQEHAGLLTTPIWRYRKLQLPASDRREVALWFDSGDPAIVAQPFGRGRVVLLATAASTESLDRSTSPPTPWTALSTWPSFPPLVHEMIASVVRGRYDNRNARVGQPLASSIDSTAVGIPLEIRPPNGLAERLRLELDGDSSRWTFPGTDHSGVYRAEFGPPVERTELYAVNVDTAESDLARIDASELPPQLQQELEPAAGEVAVAAIAGPRVFLFRWLLAGVLGLLLIETFLAWHLGNRSI